MRWVIVLAGYWFAFKNPKQQCSRELACAQYLWCYGDVNYCGDLLNDIHLKLKYCSYLVTVITFWNSYNYLHRVTQVHEFCEWVIVTTASLLQRLFGFKGLCTEVHQQLTFSVCIALIIMSINTNTFILQLPSSHSTTKEHCDLIINGMKIDQDRTGSRQCLMIFSNHYI